MMRQIDYETAPESPARGRNGWFSQRGMTIFDRNGAIALQATNSRGESNAARLVIPRDKLGEIAAALVAFLLIGPDG